MNIKLLISIYTYSLFVILMFFAFISAYPVFILSHIWSKKPRSYFQKIVQQYFKLFYFLMPNLSHISVHNKYNINTYHPCVYVASHQSSLDYTMLATLIDDYVTPSNHFISDYPLFLKIPKYALGVHYVPKGDLSKAESSYEGFTKALSLGSSVIIFPEGTRNPTATLKRFKTGAFRLAMVQNVPLVPILINGTGDIVSKGSNITKITGKKDIHITFLDPMYAKKDETFSMLSRRVRDSMQNSIDNDTKEEKI